MATDNQENEVWPPAPNAQYQAPTPPAHKGLLSWLTPILAALIGAGVGAILLPLLLLAAFYIMDDAGGPIFFMMAMVAAVGIGAVLGMVFGLCGRLILKFIVRKHQHVLK